MGMQCISYNSLMILIVNNNIFFQMAYIKELIESLFDEESEGNIQSFKKLIYLAVNETKMFAAYVVDLANMVCPALHCIQDSTTKIYALQLLSELATNYQQQLPPSIYDFPQIISLLSDDNAEVRKASHYLLLIFIKKYERIDEIIKGYTCKIKQNPDQWKQIQKIIHSFQSLLVIEPKCISYNESYTHLNDFLRMIIAFRNHQHALIQKAADQTINSFIKSQYISKVINKIDKTISKALIEISEKVNINLNLNSEEGENEEEKHESQAGHNELEEMLQDIQQQSDWKIKSDIIEQISKRVQSESHLNITSNFIEKVLDFTYDYNFKICITAMNIIYSLINKYPHQITEKVRKIEDIMIEKVCDLKMAVRQIACKILRKIFSNSSKESAKKIFAKLSNCSVIGKEQIIGFVQDYYTLVSPIDLNLVLGEVATQLSNENTKIKIKTLDCLVKISLSTNLEQCKYFLQKKLNKVYYDMFAERLKEKTHSESKQERWDDQKNNNVNKGMTWQAQKSPNFVQNNDRFLTKVQFAKKVEKNFYQEDIDFKYEAPTFGGFQKKESIQKGVMLGTSHTSNETYSSYDRVQDSVGSKFSKKSVESYRPNVLSNFQTVPEKTFEEKKLPLKPKPVKKIAGNNTENYSEQSQNLIIQSKEYQNKNEQLQDQKPVKQLKLKKSKEVKVQKPPLEQMVMQGTSNQPFTIKKSNSKKEHQIDYKATQYVAKEELAPVAQPKELLKEIIANLPKNGEWAKQFDALDGLRRIIKHHEEIFPLIHQNLPAIMPQVLKLVESLRSTLAKNGMITLAEMCEAFKKYMDPFLDAIFIKLIKKALDTNTFIIQQVNKCVKSLCTYCTSTKISVIIINNSQSKSIPIKLKVIFCIDKLFQTDGYSLNLLKENGKILGVMGNYIIDGANEVRGTTKDIFLKLYKNNNKAQMQSIFKKSSKQVWQKWKSIIDKELK